MRAPAMNQDQWHQLAFHSKHVPEPHAPAVEWPPIMATWTEKDTELKMRSCVFTCVQDMYVHTCMHAYIHTYIHIFSIYVCVCMHSCNSLNCVFTRASICLHTCVYVNVCVCVQV